MKRMMDIYYALSYAIKDKLEKCLKDLNLHYVNSEKNVYGIEVAENDIIKMLSIS